MRMPCGRLLHTIFDRPLLACLIQRGLVLPHAWVNAHDASYHRPRRLQDATNYCASAIFGVNNCLRLATLMTQLVHTVSTLDIARVAAVGVFVPIATFFVVVGNTR